MFKTLVKSLVTQHHRAIREPLRVIRMDLSGHPASSLFKEPGSTRATDDKQHEVKDPNWLVRENLSSKH